VALIIDVAGLVALAQAEEESLWADGRRDQAAERVLS
jgi:hypothetical protein